MKDIYKKATVSKTEVEDLYIRELEMDVDGANNLISLYKTYKEQDSDPVRKTITITFDELRSINKIMRDLEQL